jgi:hypothetical protein
MKRATSRKPVAVCFTGNEGSYITLAQGRAWTGNFRRANSGAIKAHFFGKTKLAGVLKQTSCVGIRMYHALSAAGAAQLVLIGVNRRGVDLTRGYILEVAMPCPTYCDNTSALNGARASSNEKSIRFTGNEGRYITVAQGKAWTRNFRRASSGGVKAHFFGQAKLNGVLNQTGCAGIRMYHAIDATEARQLVLVGVNGDGVDLTTGLILDMSVPCPSYCDTKSSLNGTARRTAKKSRGRAV